jgi:hypothetical protein
LDLDLELEFELELVPVLVTVVVIESEAARPMTTMAMFKRTKEMRNKFFIFRYQRGD